MMTVTLEGVMFAGLAVILAWIAGMIIYPAVNLHYVHAAMLKERAGDAVKVRLGLWTTFVMYTNRHGIRCAELIQGGVVHGSTTIDPDKKPEKFITLKDFLGEEAVRGLVSPPGKWGTNAKKPVRRLLHVRPDLFDSAASAWLLIETFRLAAATGPEKLPGFLKSAGWEIAAWEGHRPQGPHDLIAMSRDSSGLKGWVRCLAHPSGNVAISEELYPTLNGRTKELRLHSTDPVKGVEIIASLPAEAKESGLRRLREIVGDDAIDGWLFVYNSTC